MGYSYKTYSYVLGNENSKKKSESLQVYIIQI